MDFDMYGTIINAGTGSLRVVWYHRLQTATWLRLVLLQVPALLLLPASALGPSNFGGTPVDNVLNMCATYEWYTSQWLMAAAKERQPQQMTSFAAMHS